MIAEHARLMSPKQAEPMTEAEFEDGLAAIRAMNLPDVKV